MSISGGTVTVTNCTIRGNTSEYGNGGAAFRGETVLVVNSTISGNTAGGWGGGVQLYDAPYGARYGGTVLMMNSTVSGNTALGRFATGGGVAIGARRGGTITLLNSTVSGNTALDRSSRGGGVAIGTSYDGSRVELTNNTISGNSASDGGGTWIAAFRDSTVQLSRNLIAGNTAPSGAEVFEYDRSNSVSAALNLFGHTGLTTAQAFSGFAVGGSDILATSKGKKPTALADILDTTLRNNGGPTLTQNLVAGSPAIDAAGATCDLTTDQRGGPRPVDGNGDGVAACDIGAVEFGAFSSALDCSTATARVDFPRLGNRHRYKVDILGVTAPQGDTVGITINSIFQDEPVTSPTGKTCPDGIGVGTAVAKVRNERIITSAGDGRVYHIGFTATDEAGASCTGEVQVCVPVKEGEACGDQGALFDSTMCP